MLVHGDTSTSFVTALACFYMQIPVGHVEAGLRTYNIYSPYPEEFNRQGTGIIARYNFSPTPLSASNLIREGKREDTIYITGNTVIDAMQHTVREDYTHPELDWVGDGKLIFITAHRRENLGEPMRRMFRAIRRVLDEHPECRAVYPIHMNPAVREAAAAELSGCDRIHIIEPIEVFDCHNFEARSYLCLTDSGGIQEECPSYGVPVLVMRDTTERPEGVEAGTLKLVGTDEDTGTRYPNQLYATVYYPTLYQAFMAAASLPQNFEDDITDLPENYSFWYEDYRVVMLADATISSGETWEVDSYDTIRFDLNGHTFDVQGAFIGGYSGTRVENGQEISVF